MQVREWFAQQKAAEYFEHVFASANIECARPTHAREAGS